MTDHPVPGAVLSVLHVVNHLILMTIYEVGAIISSIVQMKKWKNWEIK